MKRNIMVSENSPREIGALEIMDSIDEFEHEWGVMPYELEDDWEEQMELRRRWLWECAAGMPRERPWQLD